jgi:DNA repair protein RadA/Sms
VDTRIGEAKKMGFKRCLVPDSNLKRIPDIDGIKISGISKVSEAVDTLF